jgi:hypothetical protein
VAMSGPSLEPDTIHTLARYNTLFFEKNLKLAKIMHVTNLAAGNFLNNLIGCISWYAYFYFLTLGQFRFLKRVKTVLNSYFNLFYLSFVQKPWFKFKYLNPSPKVPDLKCIQKVYFKFS